MKAPAHMMRLALHAWSRCMIDQAPMHPNLTACSLSWSQALVKILDDVTDAEIKNLEIATGVPLIYELNEDMQPIRHFHVG